jgi:DNA-binding MarR family transcriptional regulator/ribosomal protein S18 acetylase RimI-like enzyme
MDLIKSLGEMALGSRLKRLTKRMDADISRIYEELGMDFNARWFPVVYQLARRSPLSVTELAELLGFSHTAIANFSRELIKQGWLVSESDPIDKRRRLLRLSEEGEAKVAVLVPIWEEIRIVVDDLVSSAEPNILEAVSGLEAQLDQAEMYTRLRGQFGPQLIAGIEILDYRPALKKHFKALNAEWLNRLFKMEPADVRVLDDPNGQIIRKGGCVYFARVRGEIVGTAALVKHKNGVHELTKMAVTRRMHGRLVGTKLTEVIIGAAIGLGLTEVYLETHPSMVQAIRFYERNGFEVTNDHELPEKYRRGRVVMVRHLDRK